MPSPRHLRPLAAAALLAIAAACSRSPETPPLTDDLRRDLARAGLSDIQLAGSPGTRVDVVSAAEQSVSPAPAPRAPRRATAASSARGVRAPVRRAAPTTPAATAAPPSEAAPAGSARPQAPQPSTQREPPGGWKTIDQIRHTLPFPITP